MATVQFEGVGARNLAWVAEVDWTELALLREVRRHKALVSRAAEVLMKDASTATIYVGFARPAGTVRKLD